MAVGRPRGVQNTPTGCGNDFHTWQVQPQKIVFSTFFKDIPSIIDLMKFGTGHPLWRPLTRQRIF